MQICTMLPIARSVSAAGRLLSGVSVLHPVGEPRLSAGEEAEGRYRLVVRALAALQARPGGEAA